MITACECCGGRKFRKDKIKGVYVCEYCDAEYPFSADQTEEFKEEKVCKTSIEEKNAQKISQSESPVGLAPFISESDWFGWAIIGFIGFLIFWLIEWLLGVCGAHSDFIQFIHWFKIIYLGCSLLSFILAIGE